MSRQTKTPRYAPARDDGLKPWVVERREWGQKTERIVYARGRADAEYEVKGRQRFVYAKARRATPEDIEVLRGAL